MKKDANHCCDKIIFASNDLHLECAINGFDGIDLVDHCFDDRVFLHV